MNNLRVENLITQQKFLYVLRYTVFDVICGSSGKCHVGLNVGGQAGEGECIAALFFNVWP
jgi:hypothetical protein